MKFNTQPAKWYLFVVLVLAFAIFSFPQKSSAKTDNAGGGSQILPGSQFQGSKQSPYPPAYPKGTTSGTTLYDEYLALAKQDVTIGFKDFKIPGGLKKWRVEGNTIIYDERCDPQAEAFGMYEFDLLSRESEVFSQVPISGTMGAAFRGIAEAAVMRCQFQDAMVDSAEIEAGYENTKIIINQLNNANTNLTTIRSKVDSNLDMKISTRATQKSVNDLQATIDNLSTSNLDATISSRASQDSLEALTLAVGRIRSEYVISQGLLHTCSLTTVNGVLCWGDNRSGQLGDGNKGTDSNTPVNVSGFSSGVKTIAAGFEHTCALTTSGAVKCWGLNFWGQLGDGNKRTDSDTPVNVTGLSNGVVVISAGQNNTCALTTSGAVKCWGENGSGQLGDGNKGTDSDTPVNVTGLSSGVAAISSGPRHTCALMKTGAVKCWGDNLSGQLGDGNKGTDSDTPVNVTGLSGGVTAVSAGFHHTCALMKTGAVKCWGENGSGQLGNGNKGTGSDTPVNVVGLSSGVEAVSVGVRHTCVITTSGAVKCWGDNEYGQLGDGNKGTDSDTPVNVAGLSSGVEAIFTGFYTTCALMTSGDVKCWGRTIWLSNDTFDTTNVPLYVQIPNSSLTDLTATRASQSSLDALQASVDALDLSNLSRVDEKISSRASQESLTSLQKKVDANLDVRVSTLASKEDLSPLATQDNLDVLIKLVNDNLDAAISSRASQDSLDALQTATDSLDAAFVLVLGKLTSDLDVAVSTRASQESLDKLQNAVDATNEAISIVQDKLNADLDIAVSTRASQADLDELRSVVDEIATELSKLDVAVSTRASQESLDELHLQVGDLNEASDRIESKVDALTKKADTIETKVKTIQSTLDHCGVKIAIVNGPGGRNYTFYVHTTWHGERKTPSQLTVWVGGDQQQPSSRTVIPGVTSVTLSGVKWNDLRNQPLTVEATLSGGTCSAVEIMQ